jgi:hypothetical protein
MENEDDPLLMRLGGIFRANDRPPIEVMELARLSFTLRNVDSELAVLVEDSEAAQSLAAVRRTDTADRPRQLTFEAHGLILMVEVEIVGPHRRLNGQLQPLGPADLELLQPNEHRPRAVHVDDLGRFIIDAVPPGSTSLTCRRAGSAPVSTAWTLL